MEIEQPAKKSKLKKLLPATVVILIVGSITLGLFFRPVFSGDNPLQKSSDTTAPNGPLKLNLYQASVSITARAFSPSSVKIKSGESVAWLNKDRSMHLIVSDTGLAGFKGQGNLLFNDMYLYTFTVAGTYTYHDQLNPSLKGTVVVE